LYRLPAPDSRTSTDRIAEGKRPFMRAAVALPLIIVLLLMVVYYLPRSDPGMIIKTA
jgi:hypothetical protein